MIKNWKGLYRLLERYNNGTINPIKKQVVDFWYDTLGSNDIDETLTEDRKLKAEIWKSIKSEMHGKVRTVEPQVIVKWWESIYVKLVAACLVLSAGFIFYKSATNRSSIIAGVPESAIRELHYLTNDGGKIMKFKLSDKSEVTLSPGATLYYPQKFVGKERTVFLKGDGFFSIISDKHKSFLVYSDHIVTTGVGTSFSIRKRKGGSIEVSVVSGTLQVKENVGGTTRFGKEKAIILTPNKKVTFFPQN